MVAGGIRIQKIFSLALSRATRRINAMSRDAELTLLA
jgi:hypothetical protein